MASLETSPGFKTTLYYSPTGVCEAAYVELAEGRPIRRAEPDPRYLVTVYFGDGDVPLGVRIGERLPASVVDATVRMMAGASPIVARRVADAAAACSAAA